MALRMRTSVGYLRRGAERPHRPFLNRSQQLDLHVLRQFPHFVQEQRATLRRLEQASLVVRGPGKTALFITEQFAFH